MGQSYSIYKRGCRVVAMNEFYLPIYLFLYNNILVTDVVIESTCIKSPFTMIVFQRPCSLIPFTML